jgi:hypothetical protein
MVLKKLASYKRPKIAPRRFQTLSKAADHRVPLRTFKFRFRPVSNLHPHHTGTGRSDPRAGYTHTAHAVCAWGWGPGTMRSSHGATSVQSATTAGCSHSRWVDPHMSYVHPHHRSDPRAGYTHTAHAVCAWGWGPGTMRSSHGATSVQSATTAGCRGSPGGSTPT